MSYKILVIDDDASILRLMKNVLSMAEYDVTTREVIEEINLCDFIGFDLILMDIMMPVNGLDICRYIRDEIKTPIIFITAKDMEEDLIKGIQAGADDYITKPFSMKELLARVKMHLRREERYNDTAKILSSGSICIDLDKRNVMIGNKVLPFTKREFIILHLLAENPSKTFSVMDIFEKVYPISSNTQPRSVAEYVYQIRNKFKPYGINPIETMWGGGYRWRKEEVSQS